MAREKKTSMTISYEAGGDLYLNITNACPCRCIFCIRNNGDNVYDTDPLWLEHTPTFDEIKENLEKRDLSKYREIVFCGFGEPTSRFDMIKQVCDYLHTRKDCPKIRLNTNGLMNHFLKRDGIPELAGKIDSVSVSLNAGNAKEYGRVTCPGFDSDEAFKTVCDFITEAKKYIPEVKTTVVGILSPEETESAKKKAAELGVPLRVRVYSD